MMERLEEGTGRRLTLICAPAGFGKTTLVREWMDHARTRAAWLSLDSDDREVSRFLSGVVMAIQSVHPNIGCGVLRRLERGLTDPVEPVLMALIRDLESLSDDLVLVLEDYHATESAKIDRLMQAFLRYAPHHVHFVVTSREDPRLPLSRLRLDEQLIELRASDLRFTGEESERYLVDQMGLALSVDEVATLEGRTEGWIAGLKLAALSLQGRTDASEFVKTFAGDDRYVVDYLVEEVLSELPHGTRSFLLKTAILGDMCGTLCDAVTGQGSGASTLLELERANLFLVPLDDKRTWFRYHHLFRDLLRAQLSERFPDELSDLHLRASEWFEAAKLPADALRHALLGGHYGRVERLIADVGPVMRAQYQVSTLLEWLKDLPESVFSTYPVLALENSRALMDAGELEGSETRLRDAELWLQDLQADSDFAGSHVQADARAELYDSLPVKTATARAYLSQARGDVDATVLRAREALDLIPEDDIFERGVATSLLGLASWSRGDLDDAYEAFAAGLASMERSGNVLVALSGTYLLADIRIAQGRLADAERVVARALERTTAQGEPWVVGTANLYLSLSEIAWERGAWHDAVRHFECSEELRESAALPDTSDRWYIAEARYRAAGGDTGSALRLLKEAERHHIRSPVPEARPIRTQMVRLWLAEMRFDQAAAWAARSGFDLDDDVTFLGEFGLMTFARVITADVTSQISRQEAAKLLALLSRIKDAAVVGARIRSAVEASLLLALAHQALGDVSRGLTHLEFALASAEEQGLVGIFVDEGPSIAPLLSRASAHGINASFTEELLAGLAAQPVFGAQPHESVDRVLGALPDPLTPRELEVLRMIADGLSNDQICGRLHRALSTVKGYNQSIFEKLQVGRRTEAVARARELNLL